MRIFTDLAFAILGVGCVLTGMRLTYSVSAASDSVTSQFCKGASCGHSKSSKPMLFQCNVLTLSGGGSYGAVELGILEALLRNRTIPTKFDLIAGISAGGVNAALLSSFETLERGLLFAKPFMFNLTTQDIYKRNIAPWHRWSLYNTFPLENTLWNMLRQAQSLAAGQALAGTLPGLLLGSTNINKQHLALHYWNATRHRDLNELVPAIMATSAIPFAFPPVYIRGDLHQDGGVVSSLLFKPTLRFLGSQCSRINIYAVRAHPVHSVVHVTSLSSYIKATLHTLLSTFDDEWAQLDTQCAESNIQVHLSAPEKMHLPEISVLDFNHNKELFEAGFLYHDTKTYNVC